MASLQLELLSPDQAPRQVEQVAWIRLRLADEGWLTVYPRHAPLLAQTLAGQLTFQEDGAAAPEQLACGPGILSIRDNRVLLLMEARHEPNTQQP